MHEQQAIQQATGLIADVLKALSNHGFEGLLGLWLLYEKFIAPRKGNKEIEQKKASGEWVDWKDVKQVKEEVSELKTIVNLHLEKEQEEDVKMGKMEKDIQYHGEEISETKGDVKDIFRLLSEIKNMIIERKA